MVCFKHEAIIYVLFQTCYHNELSTQHLVLCMSGKHFERPHLHVCEQLIRTVYVSHAWPTGANSRDTNTRTHTNAAKCTTHTNIFTIYSHSGTQTCMHSRTKTTPRNTSSHPKSHDATNGEHPTFSWQLNQRTPPKEPGRSYGH